MGIKKLFEPVARTFTVIASKTRVNSPKTLFYGGCVLMTVGAGYGVYKAYKGASEVSEKYHDGEEYIDNLYPEGKGYKKERFFGKAKNVASTGLVVAKQQAVPAVIFASGLYLSRKGYQKMAARAIMLAGIAAETKKELDDFFERVKNQYGEEEATKLKEGLVQDVQEVTSIDPTTGEVSKKKEIVYKNTGQANMMYSYILEEATMDPRYWTDSAFLNSRRLKEVIARANALLNERGYVFLSEVLRMLGYKGKLSEREHFVGWIKKGLVPNWHGDGFISDGVTDRVLKTEAVMAFLSGTEPNVMVNWNVDGYIVDALNQYNLW